MMILSMGFGVYAISGGTQDARIAQKKRGAVIRLISIRAKQPVLSYKSRRCSNCASVGGTVLGGSCLAERLGKHVRLTAGEREALERFEGQDRTYRRGAVVIREHESPRELFIVRSGWLHSSVVLGNGSRQIIRFHFQGDMLGMPLLAFAVSPESVTAVTDVTLSSFGRERIAALVVEQPRLAALILSLTVAERVMFADRLASLGRTPARARVAALLCDIYMRMRALGTPEGGPIPLPLTQEDIGDATGLTAVHVNRMMRVLVEEKVIERRGGVIGILDEARLCAEASFLDRVELDTGWLPPPR